MKTIFATLLTLAVFASQIKTFSLRSDSRLNQAIALGQAAVPKKEGVKLICSSTQFLIQVSGTYYCVTAFLLNCDQHQDLVGCTSCPSGYTLKKNVNYTFETNLGFRVTTKLDGCVNTTALWVLYGIIAAIICGIGCCIYCCIQCSKSNKQVVVNGGQFAQQ